MAQNGESSALVDAATLGVVREYLSRRGFKAALAELDAARPLAEDDLTSRADIVHALRLEALLHANRKRAKPLRTLLEMLVSAYVDHEEDDGASPSDLASKFSSVSLPSGGPLVEAAAAAALAASIGGKPPPPPGLPQGAPHALASVAPSTAPSSIPPTAPLAGAQSAVPGSRPRPVRPKSAHKGVRTPNTLPVGFEKLGTGTAAPVGSGSVTSMTAPAAEHVVDPHAPRLVQLCDQSGARLVVRPGEVNGGQIELSELVDCEVLLLDWSQQVTLDACRGCRVLVGPVDGSLMLRDCNSIQMSAVCRQLRCRDCEGCVLRLFTLKPIIESSARMTFGPWNAAYPRLATHLAKAAIDPVSFHSQWHAVHDFNEPELASGATPKNWTLLPEASYADQWVVELVDEGHGASESPLAVVPKPYERDREE